MHQPVITNWSSWTEAPASDQSPVQRLSRLPIARRQRLARLTGAPHPDAASLVDHLSRSEVACELLMGLSPAARQLARLFVEAVEPLPARVLETEMHHRLRSEEAAQTAYDELEQSGIVARFKWAGGAEVVGMIPPLTRSARSYLWLLGDECSPGSWSESRVATRASVHLDEIRKLLLALAALASDPPRLSREGEVHQADLQKIVDERFGRDADEGEIGAAMRRLVGLGLVAGLGNRARVVWWRAHAFFGLPPGARLPLLLATDPPGLPGGGASVRVPGLASAEHVRQLVAAALLELPSGYWARREALEGAVRVRILATDALTPYTDAVKAALRARQHVTRAVTSMLTCLDVKEAQSDTWLRLPLADPGNPEATWVVQPTHEIMVPPEVLPGPMVRLVTVADLARADVVATFHMDPHSVARAAQNGLDLPEIMRRLGAGTAHELPPTLPVQIEGWLRQAALALAEEDGKELPGHLRPPSPPLPKPPSPRWPAGVSRFRKQATQATA